MKNILFLTTISLAMILLNACSNDDEDKEKSWTQKQIDIQDKMHEKISDNIIGNWKEYMFKGGMTGKWTPSSEKGEALIAEFTFKSNGVCNYKNVTEKAGKYAIKKNPDYIDENKIASGPHCCIIIEIKHDNGINNSYSALIDDDGTLKLHQVSNLSGEYREPEYDTIFKKNN